MAAEKTKPAKEAAKAALRKLKPVRRIRKTLPSDMLISRALSTTPLFQLPIQQGA